MTEDIRQAVGLLRHQIISPVLMESGRAQMSYFRKVSELEFNVPGVGLKRFAPETMRSWLKRYRKHGFKGIIPSKRADSGRQRLINAEVAKNIEDLRSDLLDLSVAQFYRRCLKANLLGEPPLCLQTVRRFLKAKNLFPQKHPAKGRRRFEMDYFGELWVGDFMHGPMLTSPKRGKAILLGIIDDHTRMIVGYRWSFQETTLPIELVFKEALLKYGKCDRIYVDNGPSFSSQYLRLVCARLDIGLIHSKPYDSPSRGKIERFWRTVRERFLSTFAGTSLKEINEAFALWLREEYHLENHAGIGCRPIDRYQLSISEYPRARANEDILEESFLMKITRKVNKDATVSFRKLIYEVPVSYIGKKVDLRYRQDRPQELFLYEDDQRVTAIKVVDARANGKLYKPRTHQSCVPYQTEEK